MKIERKDSRKSVLFEEVKRGDFFEWNDTIYFKIGNGEWEVNAYNCEVNTVTTFDDEAQVTLLKAKVVIE